MSTNSYHRCDAFGQRPNVTAFRQFGDPKSIVNRTHHPTIILTILACLSIITSSLFAQIPRIDGLEAIKENPFYISADCEAADIDEARKLAAEELVRRIQVSITVAAQEDIRESDYDVHRDYTVRRQSFSGLVLKGLEYKESQTEFGWKALAYIHRDSLAASLEQVKHRIRGLVDAGLSAESEGRIDVALHNFYRSFLLAYTYPDTIHILLPDGKMITDIKVACRTLLNETLDGIEIVPSPCYFDASTIIAPLRFVYRGKPVRELSISYYGGTGMEYAIVIDGQADIPLHDNPTSRFRKLALSIEYVYESEMINDSQLKSLHEIFGESGFNNFKRVDLTFPWIDDENDRQTATSSSHITTEIVESDEVVEGEAINVLTHLEEWTEFADILEQYSKLGMLTYTRGSDLSHKKGCYVAVVAGGRVAEIMRFDGNKYRSIRTGKVFGDLKSHFAGHREIWIKQLDESTH